ncbi:MAG: hypothetical protein QOJ22_1217 [Thermoleophilaceae bacterium]|nr:hypothetical protein [Thermoleophilaceae bacterium]
MIELLAPLADVLQIAHETMFQHQEPAKGNGGGASPIVILVGVVVTLAAVAGLVWVKKRTDREQEGR